MKIAVSAMGPTLDAAVDSRFGRCTYLVFVESDGMSFEAVENANVVLGGGAGVQTSQLVSDKGAEVVLTGNCGPNAFQTMGAAGVDVYVGVTGTVKSAVEAFVRGDLSAARRANVLSHYGMNQGE